MKYPRRLSSGANNIVLALNSAEAAKLYLEDTRSDLGSEAQKMRYANAVNGLICRFIRLDYDEALKADLLVMERIYPIDYRAYEAERRQLWLDVFRNEIRQLHEAGFVHRDLIPNLHQAESIHFDFAGVLRLSFVAFGLRFYKCREVTKATTDHNGHHADAGIKKIHCSH